MEFKWIIKPKHENKPDLDNRDKTFIDAEGGCSSESELLDAFLDWRSYGSELEDEKEFYYVNKCFLRFSISAEGDADADGPQFYVYR